MKILANLEGVQLGKSLGVPHFTLNTLTAMHRHFDLQTISQVSFDAVATYQALPELSSFVYTIEPGYPRIIGGQNRSMYYMRRLYQFAYQSLRHKNTSMFQRGCALEFSPHHFQPRASRLPQVVVCFDLHIFDVPWKYQPYTSGLLKRFSRNMQNASAVITPFIRPFRKLPLLFEGIQNRLFYVDCPTLLGDIPLHQNVLDAMRQRFLAAGEQTIILYPAALQQHKNHKQLISALVLLRKAGRDCLLICPGSSFKEEITSDIQQHAADLGMCDRVCFPGFMTSEEVRALYALCTIAVSPSLAEGGNMIAQEAVAFGKPVACADTEASREQIALMGARIPVFDADDPAAMSAVLAELIDHGAMYVAANEAARRRVGGWTWNSVAGRFWEIFGWVAQGCRPDARPSLAVTAL